MTHHHSSHHTGPADDLADAIRGDDTKQVSGTTQNASSGVLGKIVQHSIDHVEFLPARKELSVVTAICAEVSALCPVTHQPDLYTVTIEYIPEGQVIESKSLKLYLWRFRDMGISCEDLAATIAHDLHRDHGGHFTVVAQQQSRGGIVLIGHAEA